MTGINVEDVKKYNEALKAQQDRASKINAEIEFNSKELVRLCAELTTELGVQVTLENIEEIYQERVTKINNTLQSGNEILKRIADEEATLNAQNTAQINPVAGARTVSAEENFGTAGQNAFPIPPAPPENAFVSAQNQGFVQGATPVFKQSNGPVFAQRTDQSAFNGFNEDSNAFGEAPSNPGSIMI